MTKVVLITSNHLRHKFLADSLYRSLELTGIVSEKKSGAITDTSGYSGEDKLLIENHFLKRDETERNFFGEFKDFPDVPVFEVSSGEANSTEVFNWVQNAQPDYIVLFGSSIIKDPILQAYENRIINLHLGLSPYYRGSATNLWPLFYNEPECVGATIHLAVRKVDAGSIIAQIRPDSEIHDNVHTLGCKTILKAGLCLPSLVESLNRGEITPLPQPQDKGKLLKNKDFNPDTLRVIEENLRGGMMEKFLSDYENKIKNYPIFEQPKKTETESK